MELFVQIFLAAIVCYCCILLLIWIKRCQRDVEGPAQSPPTYSQPLYHTQQQPHIIRTGPQYPSIQTQPSHIVLDDLPPYYSTPPQHTTPGNKKTDTDAPPSYSNFQDEAASVLGQKRGQQTKDKCRVELEQFSKKQSMEILYLLSIY